MRKNSQNSVSIEIEQHQNSSGENKRGAPVKNQSIIKQNFWFYDEQALKLMSVLANFGQLQFKVLSGKTPYKLKKFYKKRYDKKYENSVK